MGEKLQCESDYQATQKEYQATKKCHLVLQQRSVHGGQKFQCARAECDYQATQKGNLVTHKIFIYTYGPKVSMSKVYNICEDLYIWTNHSIVQRVVIRQFRNIAWSLIINLYIWDKSSNVQSANIS